MRCMLRAIIPTAVGNRVLADPTGDKKFRALLASMKPEAVYFTTQGGRRAAFVFFDLSDVSRIPAIAEPWFMLFQAEVDIQPAFTPAELDIGLPDIQQAVESFAPDALVASPRT